MVIRVFSFSDSRDGFDYYWLFFDAKHHSQQDDCRQVAAYV
ncbi:hypothetical protein MC7420_6319 [Coleofasciculus chthonoplastes PCC 7420]|uniref:Uncharacterized protein n=1 Tax=Coleofasciculus chthonoplastes PCC 7420 TaxID=118168 RepID=B4VR19_9CYAN|nr:hypothetical protein MC7420_6319 [Coleofasciculus chthonoplastes PCC 7420]